MHLKKKSNHQDQDFPGNRHVTLSTLIACSLGKLRVIAFVPTHAKLTWSADADPLAFWERHAGPTSGC